MSAIKVPFLQKLRSVFKIGCGSIYWLTYDKRIVCGHIGQPKPGDVFTSKMTSGKIAVFEVVNVKWCGDPSNMYFCDVKDVGYWKVPK